MQLVLLGTGSSAAVPDISCVITPGGGCECCRRSQTPEGRNNVRGNTGAILRIPQPDSDSASEKTVLIDCGKTFREQALKLFPAHGLRKIDACLLTHHHADAMNGLDELRAWTYHNAIESAIPIYCSRETYKLVEKEFSYMIDKNSASGSGAVPSFEWHRLEEGEPVNLFGADILPLPVLYCSDVSFIPESTWAYLGKALALPAQYPMHQSREHSLLALIIDAHCLQLSRSHFGFPQAIATARRLGVARTYLTNLPHKISHECWEYTCEKFGEIGRDKCIEPGANERAPPGARSGGHLPAILSSPTWIKWDESKKQASFAQVHRGFDPYEEDWALFAQRAFEAVADWEGPELAQGKQPWVRPAADGLVLSWTKLAGAIHDDMYL